MHVMASHTFRRRCFQWAMVTATEAEVMRKSTPVA